MQIREYPEADWQQIWPIVHDVVTAQETYTYDPAMTEEAARSV